MNTLHKHAMLLEDLLSVDYQYVRLITARMHSDPIERFLLYREMSGARFM